MSYDLAFWQGPSVEDDSKVYLALDEESAQSQALVAHVVLVDAAAVSAAVATAFAGWTQHGNIWTVPGNEDGNGPGFDLSIGSKLVQFTCYGLDGDQMNQVIDVMGGLGYPLYDPQVRERFA